MLGLQPSTLSRQRQRGDGMQSKAMHQRPSPSPQGTTMPGCIFKLNAFPHSWRRVRKASRPACMGIITAVVFVLPVCFKMIVRNLLLCRQNVFMVVEKMSNARCSGINTNGSLGGLKLCSDVAKYIGKHFIVNRFRAFFKRVGCYSLFTKCSASASSSQYSRL